MTDDLPPLMDDNWSEPAQQKTKYDRAEHMRRMNEARREKLPSTPPGERKGNPFSGRKKTGANPQKRKSRGKDLTINEVKELFFLGLRDAVLQARMLMMHAKNEAVRLAATSLWLERALGKIPQSIEAAHGGSITFSVVTGVPEPDDDGPVIDAPQIPHVYRKS